MCQRFAKETDIVQTHFPLSDLVWLDHTPRLAFKGAVELLNSSGWTDDAGNISCAARRSRRVTSASTIAAKLAGRMAKADVDPAELQEYM